MSGILVSVDVEARASLDRVIAMTHHIPHVLGFKLGALCSLSMGLGEAVRLIRSYTDKQIIYDHQKAGNDIPDITKRLVGLAGDAGVTGFILFPFAGPEVMQAGIEEGHTRGLVMIVGSYMTHPAFIEDDGGFIPITLPEKIFGLAQKLGVKDFVLPGNKSEIAASYANLISLNVDAPTFWTPGIGRQGGSISALGKIFPLGAKVIPIVGSSIYQAQDPAKEIERMFE